MFRRVGRFCKRSNSSPFIIYNPHSSTTSSPPPPLSSDVLTPEYEYKWIQVCAIDPAIKNCAIRIERRLYNRTDEKYTTPLKIETILQTKIDFLDPPSECSKRAIESVKGADETCQYRYASEQISSLTSYFSACQYILIESQMPINTEMMRMSQTIITTLMIAIKDKGLKPLIVEIDPKIKSSALLDAPRRMNKSALKRWSVMKAINILRSNGDDDTADYIEHLPKRDDHGDVVCYTTVWFRILSEGVHTPPRINI